MMSDERFDALIHSCYQGSLELNLWQTFLQQLKQMLSAQYVTLLLRPPQQGDVGVVLNAVVPLLDSYHAYNERYFQEDKFINLPLGKVFNFSDIVDMHTFQRSNYYREYLESAPIGYILGADVADEQGYGARLRITRTTDALDFSLEDKTLVEKILPHLTQAIVLYSRQAHLTTQLHTYQAAFDAMQMGCIILDEKLGVLSKNQAAARRLAQKHGLAIKDGQLVVGKPSEHKKFKALVQHMLSDAQLTSGLNVQALKVALDSSLAGLGLLCKTLPPTATPDAGARIAVFISDPEEPKVSQVNILEQLFGLTLSEAKLAVLLANGASLYEAADTLGVSRNTAKTHLRAAFVKTGVVRQPSLVQLILRSVASLG